MSELPSGALDPAALAACSYETDPERFASRILHPPRPHQREALRAVAHCAHPDEALEALVARGLVDEAFITDPRRVYLHGALRRARAMYRHRVLAPRPETVVQCALIAADRAGLCTAEQLARELRARLVAWGIEESPVVALRFERRYLSHRHRAARWRALEHALFECEPRVASAAPPRPSPSADELRERALLSAFIQSSALRAASKRLASRTYKRLLFDLGLALRFRRAQRRGLFVPRCVFGLPEETYQRPFAELGDPFEPLTALWSLGYTLDALTPEVTVLVVSETE